MSLIPQSFMDSVVSIGTREKANQIHWIGTGFFVFKAFKDKEQPLLITSRNVLAGKKSVVLRFVEKDTGKPKLLDKPLFKDGCELYSVHPGPGVDIAAVMMDLGDLKEKNFNLSGFDIDKDSISSADFLTHGGNAGSLVYMLGFTTGLHAEDSYFPICRLGCVARINKSEISDKKCFLIDMQNFPCNLGSPIIAKPEMSISEGAKALNRAVLIGMVHSYLPFQEPIINVHTGETAENKNADSGIILASPVEYIRDVIMMKCMKPLC